MRRLAVMVGLLFLASPLPAFAQPSVSVAPGLDVDGLVVGGDAAVALVAPDVGPTTSERRARASLARGAVRNSLHGELPEGRTRLRILPPAAGRIVIGIPADGEQPNDRRYAAVFPGERGIVVSDSTRVPGLISIADVADPDRLHVEARDDPVAYLRSLDRRIEENGRARAPAAALVAAVLLALAVVDARAAVLAFSTALWANLALGIAGLSAPWVVVPFVALAAAAALPLARRTHVGDSALALAGVGVLAGYGVAMAVDATFVALSPLGPSQNARFYGLSNLLAMLLLVPALTAAALGARRAGWAAFAAVAALSLAVVASSRLGADGGGALVLAAGFTVLAAALVPADRRPRTVAVVGAALVAGALVAVVVGPQTHVGETISDGPAALAGAVVDRLELSWRRLDALTALAVAASLGTVAALVARGPRSPLAIAFASALAVSMLVNDSPREVAVGGLVGYVSLARLR